MKHLLFFFILIQVSCIYDDLYRIDKKLAIIPEVQLETILLEIHLAREIRHTEAFRVQYPNYMSFNMTDSVLAKHGYKKADLDSTLKAYAANPKKIEEMYDRIIARLSVMEGNIEEEIKKDTLNLR